MSERERQEAVYDALQRARGNVTAAGALMGLDRRQVYRWLARWGGLKALAATLGRPAHPEAEAEQADPGETMRHLTVDVPRALVEWLEIEALKRKHLAGGGHPSKSAIVVEAIEAYRAALERA